MRRAGVRVANEGYVRDVLQPHHRHALLVLDVRPEHPARRQLRFQLGGGHVGLVPAVGGDFASVGLGPVVDHGEEGIEVTRVAPANHRAGWALTVPGRTGPGAPGGRSVAWWAPGAAAARAAPADPTA